MSRPVPQLAYADGEDRSFLDAVVLGFHDDYNAEEHWDLDRRLFEWDRSFGFKAGGRWVATCGAFTRMMTTPGGSVPVAAVTVVTVAPTHRRQGLLTQMMQHQLQDVARRGEPVALLWASESLIYGRYGYGSCAPRLVVSGRTRSTAFLPHVAPADGWIEEPTKEEYGAVVPELHARLLPERPGALDRQPVWWERELFDAKDDREGASALRFALRYDADGDLDGYCHFRVKGDWDFQGPAGEVQVVELDAASGAARAALWRHVLDLDLVRTFRAWDVPVDEPLRYLVADQRAIKTEVADATYARIVDLPRALAERCYSTDLDVVIGVSDPLLPRNDGAFRIEGGLDGARVTRDRRKPDLSIGIRELGSIYLGGTSLQMLAGAGLVTERAPGSVAAVTRAFDWPRRPFCPDGF